MSVELFNKLSQNFSKQVTHAYSTSFSVGISLLSKEIRPDIYAIYGFVRFADEIVDTFHAYDKVHLLDDFVKQTNEAIENKISMNPILNQFQHTINKYSIDRSLVDTFIQSMRLDLCQTSYNKTDYETYIVGSAEVVGLMCLQIFVKGDKEKYNTLQPFARRLGAAFQKINFLRDLKADSAGLGRRYFPQWQCEHAFTDEVKKDILVEIKNDFKVAREGICKLPNRCKLGVYAAYVYYKALLMKIEHTPSNKLLESRIRINNFFKLLLVAYAGLNIKLNRVK